MPATVEVILCPAITIGACQSLAGADSAPLSRTLQLALYCGPVGGGALELEGQELPAARARVETGLGKVFLAAASGSCDKAAIDVPP